MQKDENVWWIEVAHEPDNLKIFKQPEITFLDEFWYI